MAVTDIFYYLFWWFILSAIFALGCANKSTQKPEQKEACDTYAAFYVIWVYGCLLIWVVHIVSAVIVCVWGCQGNNLETEKQLADREAQVKADEARMQNM